MTNRLCILSLSVPIQIDGRVLRQIEYLSVHYDLTVIGFGEPRFTQANVRWLPVNRNASHFRKLLDSTFLFFGRIAPALYDVWFWNRPRYKQVLEYLSHENVDGFLADDWAMNVLAVTAAQPKSIPVLFDIHEYWQLECEPNRLWLWFFSPMINHFMQLYAPRATITTTVSPIIAARYHDEIGIEPKLVFSAPKPTDFPFHESDADSIKLVHHGSAARNRHLEMMIDAVAQTDARFTLFFVLVDLGDGYIEELQKYAEQVAPNRVVFREPVAPNKIVEAISEYDVGLCLIAPTTYNYRAALPNKFFESINASLAVCTGPSAAMVEMINQYGFGFVSPSFEASDLAKSLNALTIEQIRKMRVAAREASCSLNADQETSKFVQIFEQLIESREAVAT